MKKTLFLLLLLPLLGRGLGEGLLFAQNPIDVSGLKVEAGTVTFNVKWSDAGASNLWSDTVWVFVDYNKNGKMTRMLLEPGSTLTATSSPGVGELVEENIKGAWVVGDARTKGSFSATVQLLTATADLHGACAYASSYPPVGQYVSSSEIVFSGTPWYEIKLLHSDGYTVETIESGGTFLLPCSYTVSSFTDATGAPGVFDCIQPTAYTLSGANVCEGAAVTLMLAGSESGWRYQLYKDNMPVAGTEVDGTGSALIFTDASAAVGGHIYTVQTLDGAGVQCDMPVSGALNVTVESFPVGLTFTSTLVPVCEGEPATLVALPAGAASYSIDGTAWQSSNTFTVPAPATSYPLYVQTAAGCSNTVTNAVTVAINPVPDAPTMGGNGNAYCDSGTITAAAGNNGSGIRWTDGDGSNTVSPRTVTASGTYYAVTTSDEGCESGTMSVSVTIATQPGAEGEPATCGCAPGLNDCSGTCKVSCTAFTLCTGITEVSDNASDGITYGNDQASLMCRNKYGTDWRAPNSNELSCLCENKSSIPGGFLEGERYWSATRGYVTSSWYWFIMEPDCEVGGGWEGNNYVNSYNVKCVK
jgi:hypothetical protein